MALSHLRTAVLACAGAAAAAQHVCDITAYGASVTASAATNTRAIASAVAACAAQATPAAAATVLVPGPGAYLTGPVALNASYLTLLIDDGATLLGSPDPADWPVIAGLPSYPGLEPGSDGTGYWRWQPLVSVWNARNVTIAGSGTLDGQGDAFFWPAWFNGSLPDPLNMHRPYLLELTNCTHCAVHGLRLRRSPFWTVHVFASSYVAVTAVDIYNPVGSPNTDGVDPDSSDHITIADSVIANGDDCIAIKSGRGPAGAAYNRPAAFVEVRNVTLRSGLGITLGAEAAGGSHDIWVHNITATNVLAPVHIQNTRWLNPTWAEGGAHRNVVFEDYTIGNALYGVYINLFWGDIEGTGNGPFPSDVSPPPVANATTPRLFNVTIRNLRGLGAGAPGGHEAQGLYPWQRPVAALPGLQPGAPQPLTPGMDVFMVGNLQCPPEAGCAGLTLANIDLAGYKAWSCANIAAVTASSVSPDPGLWGCLGNASVLAPSYHASAFQ